VRRDRGEARRDQQLQKAKTTNSAAGRDAPVDGPLRLQTGAASPNCRSPRIRRRARLNRTARRRHPRARRDPLLQGLGGTGVKMMERLLEPYNLVPMQAGGAAVPAEAEASFEPGAAIAVPITTGDIEMTAIGTLTYLDDGVALGFGHPFFGFGQVEMPMATGYIHGVIGSLATSNKLGGMLKPVGAITQDRPTCIGGTMGRLADTLPVQYTLTEAGRGGSRDFSIRLVRHPSLTDLYTVVLMQMAMQNVAGGYFDGVTRSAVTIQTRVPEAGQNLIIKRSNSFDSKAASDFGGNPLWDLFMTLSLLRSNPFGEADVASVQVDMQFETARRFANIERAQAAQQTVKRGERFDVEVFLKPYGGQSTSLKVPVQVPENAPLGRWVCGRRQRRGGHPAADQPAPSPHDVPSLIHWLNDTVPNDSLVVEKVLPTFGLEMSGHQLHDIPAPIVEPLFTATVDDMRLIPDVDENVIPTADVVAGVAGVMVEVIGDEGQRAEGAGGDLANIPVGPMMMPESPMMGEMMNAAARTMASLTSDLRPTPELSWTLQPPSMAAASPALQRLERISAALGGARPATVARAPARRSAGLGRLSAGHQPAPSRHRPAPRQADVETAPAADETGPPDVTETLKLDDPPKMPTWKELEELGDGKMTSADAAESTATSEGEEPSEEDQPLARPVSTWDLTSVEDFVAGRFDGSYPSGDGSVNLAPLTAVLGKPGAERIWSVLALKDGTVVTGSWGPEATVFRLGADQKVEE